MRWYLLTILVAVSVAGCAQSASPLSPDLEAGRDTYRDRCATCHGGNGEGGAGPALAGVIETFSSCDDQKQWISLGSARFQSEVGPAYGDQDTEITGVMPEFSASLTDEEIARVAAYERHEFGGATPSRATEECGL